MIQLAATTRSAEPEPEEHHRNGERIAAPPPDLDALARQVYGVLKRRLSAEHRRRST
jgi:hypothetical protein